MTAIALRHPCPVDGCEQEVRMEYLMCGFHWARVSHATRRRVYKTFRERHWSAYQDARDLAIREAGFQGSSSGTPEVSA